MPQKAKLLQQTDVWFTLETLKTKTGGLLMLVLTRKKGEQVFITVGSTEVAVKVVKVSGGSVVLGFNAPKDVSILREELINFKSTGIKKWIKYLYANTIVVFNVAIDQVSRLKK